MAAEQKGNALGVAGVAAGAAVGAVGGVDGSGIVSSKGESICCLDSEAPNRIGFDLERIMRTRYRIDTYQKTYFVIDSFEQLMQAAEPGFRPIYARLAQLKSYPAGAVLDSDRVFHRGSGEGWASAGDV